MYPPVDPILFELGPLALRWYGLFMAAAIITGTWVAGTLLNKRGQDGERIWDLLFWMMIPAFIGARLYYVFIQSPRTADGFGAYLNNPLLIFQIWRGGIHIFGAFLFGGIALWLYVRKYKLPFLTYLDAIALGLPIAQAIGRWGNFINQELYGPPTTLPWGLKIDAPHRLPPYNNLSAYPESTRFHPLFLYESLWNFIGFALILWVSRKFAPQLKEGDLFLLYLIWYPLGRFFIEFLRTDSWFFANTPFNVVHVLCAIAVITGVGLLLKRHSFSSKPPAKT
jgi:phosphatidylglycerol:prolipoprotein diacylglycerol transferase